jgi:hypothetical protein
MVVLWIARKQEVARIWASSFHKLKASEKNSMTVEYPTPSGQWSSTTIVQLPEDRHGQPERTAVLRCCMH